MIDAADRAWLVDEVRRVAKSEILPRFRALTASEVRAKTGPEDLVTEADLRAEAALSEAFRDRFPEALIVGEETAAADPSLLDQVAGADLALILDPVDGTWNFAHGLAVFGVLLAVAVRGVPVWGILYDPVCDDWIVAAAGEGARFGQKPLKMAAGDMEVRTGYAPLGFIPERHRAEMAGQMAGLGRVGSLRCSCHEYRMLAQGYVDFVLSAGLMPWDHAAGALAVQEAGGVARMLDGSAYHAGRQSGYLLAVRSPALWHRLAADFGFLRSD